MSTLLNIVFLASFIGMLFSYPMYFYRLVQFRDALLSEYPQTWEAIASRWPLSSLGTAYKALQLSRKGHLDGVLLSDKVQKVRQQAVLWLYSGAGCFLVFVLSTLAGTVARGKL